MERTRGRRSAPARESVKFKANGHHDGNRLLELCGTAFERFGGFEGRSVEKSRSVLLADRDARDAAVGADFDREQYFARNDRDETFIESLVRYGAKYQNEK